jgi:glycosyltransferase involved in cell wall biosynthesis
VLADPDAQSLLLTHLAARSKMFSAERFMEDARAQINAPEATGKVVSQSPQRLKIVIGHPFMSYGGSEAAVLWLIEALKRDHDLTVITTGGWDLDRLNSYYGTKVQEEQVKVRIAPIPWFARRLSAAALRGACFQSFARKIASEYDLRISAYNPTDWGLPAIHFVADFSWQPELRRLLDPPNPGLVYRDSVIRKAYMKVAASYARPSQRDTLRYDRLIANSYWTKNLLRTICGAKCSDVIYPPVWSEFPQVPWDHKQDAFVMIGRIVPEKKIELAITVLDTLRQAGFKIRFHLCGRIGKDRYGRGIARLCRERSDWVTVEGRVSGAKKADILSRCRFGIQTRTAEPFGIAVAEMIKAGAIVFAPNDGGQTEILNAPQLLFSDRDDAINKILAVFQDPILQSDLRTHLAKQAGLFNPDTFTQAAGRCIPTSSSAVLQAIGSPQNVTHLDQRGTSLCEPPNDSSTALAQ